MGEFASTLYREYSFTWKHFWICAVAAFFDGITIIILYIGVTLFYREFDWLENYNLKLFLILAVIGCIVAILFKKWVLMKNKWDYTENMPLISFTRIAVVPVLQMMLLPALTFNITKNVKRYLLE